MPFVVAAVGAIGAAAAATVGIAIAATSVAAVVIGGIIVASAIFSVYQTYRAYKQAQARMQDPGQLINKNSNNAPIPLVYGRRRVGATRTFIRSGDANGGGSSSEYLHIVFAICEGPIEEIESIYFNDLEVWRASAVGSGASGFNTAGIATAAGPDNINFAGLIEINNQLGELNQAANGNLVSRFGVWTADHKGSGIAYSYIRFKYNRDAFSGLPTVTFLVKGRKIRSVNNLEAPEAYSTNPANVLYDYLTNEIYGRGFDSSLLDLESFQDAHDYYNINHTFLGEPLYTANGALPTDDTTYLNTQKIIACCNSALVFSNGKYKLIPFKVANSSNTITKSDIIGSWNMSLGDKTNRFNTLRTTFSNAADDYQQGSVIVQNDSFVAADNGLVLQKEISFDLIVDPNRAKLVSYEMLLQSRYQSVIEIILPHTKQTIEPMDVITFDIDYIEEELPSQYRVLDVQLRIDGTLKIRAQEYNSSVYDDINPASI